jgi:nucleotide-binding universal stress UspA family protein
MPGPLSGHWAAGTRLARQRMVIAPGREDPMSKNILLAVDAASPDPLRHVLAAADMARELSCDSGDHVIVLHVHEFAATRFGRMQVDCGEGEGEGVVEKIVSDLRAAGVSAEGEIRVARMGHIAAAILKEAQERDARLVVLGSSSRTDLPRVPLGSVSSRLLHMAARPVLIVPRSDAPIQAAQSPAVAAAAGEH